MYKQVKDVIETLKNSNLVGLGGAGFPAGLKWQFVNNQPGQKVLAVNIDESEVATFKDKYYLESNPHQFLEGALIAAWAISAKDVYLYIRNAYTAARELLANEVAKLSANPPCEIPNIHIRRGAGAYICGEESAMIQSIEGKKGLPRLKPPRISEVGLFNMPTLEHNLETLHWIPQILKNGVDWYKGLAKDGFSGQRTFSISGRVNNPGVYLMPTGTTLNELIDASGGMQDNSNLGAFFVGGSCGGILPPKMADIPLDFGQLEKYGCFIGSMAITVLSDKDSIKNSAINALSFLRDESCGQCTPCRVGTAKAVDELKRDKVDTTLLKDLCDVMADASICGLGQAAPNPILSLMKFFPNELK